MNDTEFEKFFSYTHLPPRLQEVSKPFCELAGRIRATIKPSRERDKALDKLLEAKDAAVRAFLL